MARELVLIHGGGVGSWMWRAVRRELGPQAAIRTPSYGGHRPADPTDYAGPVQAAEDVAAELGDARDLVVVGFSAGGQIALEFAARHPDRVAALVVVSSLVEPLRGGRLLVALGMLAAPLAGNRRFALRQSVAIGVDPDDVPAYLAGSAQVSRASLRALLTTTFSFRAPREAQPMLLMAGAREQRALREGLKRLAASVPGARYREVPDAAHDIPMRHARVLADELRALIAG